MTLKTDMTLGTIFRRWTILVTFVVGSSLFPVTTGLGFSPGLEYWYSLEATTFIKDAGILVTSAKVGILPLNTTADHDDGQPAPHQLCRLMIKDYDIDVSQLYQKQEVEKPNLDFSKCLLFVLSDHGEVLNIYYEQTEVSPVLSAKKTILNLMSSKLVISKSQVEKGQRWAYGANEAGHEGVHSAIYQAEPSGDTLNFVKTKTTKAMERAEHSHTKKITVHRISHVPQEFHVQDDFSTPEDSSLDGQGVDPEFTSNMPTMQTQSTSMIRLEQVDHADPDLMMVTVTEDLKETTLKADPISEGSYNLTTAQDIISANLSCVMKYGNSKRSIPCFREIIHALQKVTYDDLETIVLFYKDTKGWLVIIDALGAAGTVDALYLLASEVLTNEESTPQQIMHALVHLVHLENCPPKLMLNVLYRRAFEEPWDFSDDHVTSQVTDRTKLVVGAMVSMVTKCNQTWAGDVTRNLESLVGVHDPFHHRQMRSMMTQKEIRGHLAVKSVHIYALGNAGQTSSYNYLVSYLNTTESHMQLRFSAVEAIANFDHPEAAELLLQVALTDEEDNVRRNAIQAYKQHPHGGGDLGEFIDQQLYRYSNITSVEHKRMRRGLKEVVSRIWKGFKFNLATPTKDWRKGIGGKSLGASFGLVFKNQLDIKISPLAGHLIVDVHDGAWATIHVGILNFDFDIFRAEICFKGKIEYELNILGEYGHEDLKALARIYNDYVKKIVKIIREAITGFKGLVATWGAFDVGDIWTDFVDSIKALPKDVQNLRKVARKVLKTLEEYADLPPVYTLIKNLVNKVKTLFNDIKTDVMTLYNAIVDTVSTTIPWAWDEIRAAFNDIVEAFKNIVKGPKTAVQNIGKGAARISAAVAAVLDAKDKIKEANIFDKENRPYWFDFTKVLGDLWNDTLEIKDAIDDTIEWLKGGPEEGEEEATRYTGVDLKTMKKQALLEVWKILEQDLLHGPLEHIKRFLDPFLQTYKFFTETVNNVKQGWKLLLEGYQEARTLLDLVFGPKINKAFPRKYLESQTCGKGFWESTGQGKYKHAGVDAAIEIGSPIVAPFNGLIYDTSEAGIDQVTLEVEDLKETQVIMGNVKLNPDLDRREVGAGDVIGTVSNPRWCLDGHIHFSMRKTNVTGDYINPSRYMERRKMPPPKWREECDHYKLVWLGKTISSGYVTKDPSLQDETPDVPNEPDSSEVDVAEITEDTGGRKKRAVFDTIVDKLENFTKSLGLPGFDRLKEIFSLDINKVTLGQALDYLDEFGLSKLKENIIKLLQKVETFVNQETCTNPNSLDDNELKAALQLRGKSTSGARQTLINRYLESETKCFGLSSHVSDNIYCSYQADCLGLSCCLDLKFFIYRHAVTAFVRYDPCIGSVILGVGKWTKIIEVTSGSTEEGREPVEDNENLLDIAQLQVFYQIKQEDSVLKVSLGVRWCSTKSEECQDLIMFIREAQLDLKPCEDTNSSGEVSLTTKAASVSSLLNTSISDVIKLIEFSGIDEDEINALTEYLREAFQAWLRKQIENAIAQIFGKEFNLFDLCLEGYKLSFGPYKVVIYRSPPIVIPAGPVILVFRMGIDGYYGADFSAHLCVLSMKAVARITPRIGSGVWGSLAIHIFVFRVEFRLNGYLLTTAFPTKAEIEFNRFPLEVRARMDLQLVPLRIELYVKIQLHIDLWIGSITITLYRRKIWSYTSSAINKNIFNLNNAEPDNTPPDFSWYSRANCTNCVEEGAESSSRRKRQAIGGTPQCVVYQVVGRDYTDPAYVIELAVEDDRSPVNMTYCVGTYTGGCDVIKDRELSGTTTVTEKMHTGQRLYFKISARNNAGGVAQTTCEMSTYDMTLPTGRVKAGYSSSSDPNEMQASLILTDDSKITQTMVSLGYGEETYGTQIIDWLQFTTQDDDDTTYIGTNPLTRFHAPKEGKLPWQPFFSESHDEVEVCARFCLAYPPSKCQGFNYDYHGNGLCELLDIVEGDVERQKSSLFYYYERRGIGQLASFDFQNLQLQHDKLLFFNVYARNHLGYVSVLPSEGVLIDLTTPFPGYIQNASVDQTSVEPCTAFTPDYLAQRCSHQSPIPNYRYITDGPASMCVFNGLEPLVDQLYTRARRMCSANWDGIHDNETGILIYTYSVGTEACGFDIHPHHDPHAHLTHESEWTHQGTVFPLNLEDGYYFMTVRALNKVEYGGPLSLTVCHSQPLVVDNTPPVIHEISDASYDEDTEEITIQTNATDDLSLIKSGELGLGRSPRDTYILEWQDIEDYVNVSYVYRLPDGIPVWVKIRFTNNVDLKTTGHAPRAIFVDQTPPVAGDIHHGVYVGYDRRYQWEQESLCVVWQGFNDPDSGISEYWIALGTSPGSEDVQAYVTLSYTAASYCFTNLSLQHNTNYYVSMIAFNGASDAKNVSAESPGVLVDLTPPVEGTVKDGLPDEPDIMYSSDPATVAASWQGFADPESGLDTSQADVVRKLQGATEAAVIHEESLDPNTEHQMELHHMHFYHGDEVHVTVSVTNGAGSSSVAASDGFTVDLTDPVMYSLVDGTNPDVDLKYSASLTALSASWNVQDPESGVEHIKFTAYTKLGGRTTVIYPSSGTHKELDASLTTFTTDEPLTLTPGGFYYIRIAALNGAGLTAVHDTDGVIIDPSPPTMLYVHAGVLTDETEEVVNGFVYQNNPEGILGSWKAIDPESGILEYRVSVGIAEGDESIRASVSVGTSLDQYIGDLALELTDAVTNTPVYYINVVAINGAGMASTSKSSSPVYVVKADQTGVVWDGPGVTIEMDEDYATGHYSVTIHFSGFESELNGITQYMWALGTRPRSDDVKSFSSDGIITDDTNTRGLGNNGKAQEIIRLEQGITYYATLRAITGDGSALDSSTDGFTIDSTSPQVSLSVLGPTTDVDYSDMPVIYRQTTVVELQPGFVDTESGIADVYLSVGSYKGGNDITDQIPLNDSGVILLDARSGGQPTYFSVTAKNHVGLTSSGLSPVLVVDQTEPEEGHLSCPQVISTNDITCSWSGTLDRESGLDKFMFGIGSVEGIDNIKGFSDIDKEEISITVTNNGEFDLTHNSVYFATLSIINNVGLNSYIYSNAMRVDDTPPVSGWVIELQDFVEVDVGLKTAVVTDFSDISEDLDIICQRDITKVEIAWEEFNDEESGIDYYEVALGSTPGGTQIQQFTKVQEDSMKHTFYPVDLAAVRQVFASVRGFNGVGLFSVAVSNGVYISRHSAGLSPLSPLLVLDGNQVKDIDYQSDNSRLYMHYDLMGDPCPAISLNWTVHQFDGTIAAPTETLALDTLYAEEDGIILNDGASFFVELRVTNALDYSYSIHSDGVKIELEPLLAGDVRDGTIPGVDLNFQASVDTLSANWDGFGSDKDPQSFSDYTGDTASADIGPNQMISHYEVAIGTDRRFPSTRNDIKPFTNVGLNKTWSFYHLELKAKTSYYYWTVRAYSLATTMAEVTSNGIRVGYGGDIVALGEITINEYFTTTDEVSYSWSAFKFAVPILYHYVGLKDGFTDMEEVLDCTNLIEVDGNTVQISENFTSMFDVYPLTGVGLNTFIRLSNLSLDQGGSYTAFVVALDESGTCAMISQGFGVDTTPPTEGRIGIGPDLDLAVLYVPSTEELTVWWEGFTDDESGLMTQHIILMLGTDCDNFDARQMEEVVEEQKLSNTSTNFTYLGLNLEIGQPYYVILEVINNAKLTTQTVSKPIIVDIVGPTSGRVIDGTDFKHDLVFHGDASKFEGRILYLADPSSEACPYRTYGMTSKETDWIHIVHRGMWSLPDERIDNIVFLDKQVTYGDEGVTLTMENDITSPKVLSAALYAVADIAQGASYEFEIRAAGDIYGVTSVSIVDWNKGILSDLSSIISSGDEQEVTVTDEGDDIGPGYTVVEDGLTGDTYPEEYSMDNQIQGNSFGFHIVKDEDDLYHAILWALTVNRSRTIDFELDFDPTTDFHTYILVVNDGENPETEVISQQVVLWAAETSTYSWSRFCTVNVQPSDDWSVKLLIDSEYKGDLTGISSVGENATVLCGLYNNHGLMEETQDIFNVPKTSAIFRNLRFSASSTELCRYGNPYIGGDHPIVEFYAGIGSEEGLDDVVSFRQAAEPCIPCLYPCDEKICDQDCEPSSVQLIGIVLDEIQLEPTDNIQIDNISLPAPYYLTVRGITGSGKEAFGSSNGFYVDITPPEITDIYHIDLSWNDYEPSRYQGSNSTMGAYWEVLEEESMIAQFLWAIGTTRYGTDIQNFTDAGTETYGFNYDLEGKLENNRTYYITVKAINQAGLAGTNSSQGITTMFEEPDVSQTPTAIVGATPIGDSSNSVSSPSQTSIDLSWEDPAPSDIETTYCGVGTSAEENDIFPETPCGLNSSGSVSVNSEGFGINQGDQTNLSDIHEARKKRSLAQLMLEPGSVVFPHVRGCTAWHKCNDFPMKILVIQRPRDILRLPGPNGKITGRIAPYLEGGLQSVDILTPLEQANDRFIIIGALEESDFQEDYKTDATTNYKPYITDPYWTLKYTSREMEGRIIHYLKGGFYLTGTTEKPINGPIYITVQYPSEIFNRTVTAGRPTLLTWCKVEEIWVDASKSCNGEFIPSVDWENNMFTTPVCDIKSLCRSSSRNEGQKRKKRQTADDNGFTGPSSFVVAGTGDDIINSAPVTITNTTYTIDEDVGTIDFVIAAGDPDSDDFVFVLDPTQTHTGNVTLASNGQVTYRPCKDCFGTDEVAFIVQEVRSDSLPALETKGTMIFRITEVNDNPVLVNVQKGSALTGEVTMIVDEYQDSDFYENLKIFLVSYDVDKNGITLTVEGNAHGTLMLHGQPMAYNVTNQDCGLDYSLRQGEWDLAMEAILDQKEFTLPVPCGVEEDVEGKSLNWVATVTEYTPNKDFLGKDTIKVVARDDVSVSEMLTINVYTLANPCENNATCVGPSWDTDCTDIGRANGFDNYTCDCTPGFTGSTCKEDIDECLSSPCPTNHTCVDQINAYQCICQDGWPCSRSLETGTKLDDWMIAVISVGVLLFVVIVIAVMFCVYRYCTYTDGGSEVEPILYKKNQVPRHPRHRETREKTHLVDSNGRPLKAVSAHWVNLPRGSPAGHSNPVYERSGDFHYRGHHEPGRRRIAETVLIEEPHRHRPVHRSHSDYSLSDYERRVTKPVKRWVPRRVMEEVVRDSSGRKPWSHRHQDMDYSSGQRRGPKVKRLRRSHSASDLSPSYEVYTYA